MEETFKLIAESVALVLEFLVVAIVLIGAVEAALKLPRQVLGFSTESARAIWLRFAAWILIALEFALGADIVRTAIAPTWDDIGMLGAIAAIRTALGFFLDRDIESIGKDGESKKKPAAKE